MVETREQALCKFKQTTSLNLRFARVVWFEQPAWERGRVVGSSGFIACRCCADLGHLFCFTPVCRAKLLYIVTRYGAGLTPNSTYSDRWPQYLMSSSTKECINYSPTSFRTRYFGLPGTGFEITLRSTTPGWSASSKRPLGSSEGFSLPSTSPGTRLALDSLLATCCRLP